MVFKDTSSNKRKKLVAKAANNKPVVEQEIQKKDAVKQLQIVDKLQSSSNLFANTTTTSMASALPIWGASNILTQKKDLPWNADSNGKLCYSKEVDDGKGVVLFWVTEDLEREAPTTLVGAAALAGIDAFDIRAACMHLQQISDR